MIITVQRNAQEEADYQLKLKFKAHKDKIKDKTKISDVVIILDDVFNYIEVLEKRISELEKRK
jgi:hypothetical protein